MEDISKAYLGNFGKYQAFVYLLVFLPVFLTGSKTLTFVWSGYETKIRQVRVVSILLDI